MPKFEVDVFPTFHTRVAVVADSVGEANKKAHMLVDAVLVQFGHRFSVNDRAFGYSHTFDDRHVRVLDVGSGVVEFVLPPPLRESDGRTAFLDGLDTR